MDEPLKLPVEADTVAFVASLARAAEALEKLAHANDQSADKTEKNDKAIEGLGEKLDALKSRTKDTIEVVSQWAERINAAIEKVAELSDEGDRLARTQSSLGVSLEEAQRNAVGFVDETEVATAALTLQERGIRATQTELNALTRIASSYARSTGKELGEVMENLAETVTEGGEELGKFDLALLDVADGSHTAQERLDAMVRRAREIPDATDSATDSFRRFKDEVHDLGVVAANTFVHEFARLQEIPSDLHQARDATVDWTDALKDTAEVLATIASASVNSIGFVVGMSATGVATMVNLASAGAGAVGTLYREIRSGNVTGAAGIAGQEFNNAFEASMNSPTMQRLLAFTNAREGVLVDLLSGGPQGGGDASASGPDMTFSREDVAADARNQSARNRVSSPTRPRRRKTLAQLMDAAGGRNGLPFTGESNPDLAVLTDAGLFEESAQTERDVGKSDAARTAQEAAFGQSDETVARDRGRSRQAERERREQDQRIEQLRSFTDRWRDLHTEQVDATEQAMESVSGAIEMGSDAIGSAWLSIVTGQASVGDALQRMTSDFLLSIAKRESIEGAVEIAKGISALAGIYTAGLAPGHFAAAAAHFGVAAAAGVGGAALAPSTGGAGGGGATSGSGGGGSPSRPRLAGGGSDTGGQNTTTTVIYQYAPTFGGRQGSDAEAGQQVQRYTGAADRRRVQRDRS